MSARTRRIPGLGPRDSIDAFDGADSTKGTTGPLSGALTGAEQCAELEADLDRLRALFTANNRRTVTGGPASVALTGDDETVALEVLDAVGPVRAHRIADAIHAAAASIGGDAA